MLKSSLVFALFAIALAAATLDNAQIVKMTKAGLGEEIIIQTIKANQGSYDTGADALIQLKEAGVSDKVIAAIISRQAGTAAGAPAQEPANPLLAAYAARTGSDPGRGNPMPSIHVLANGKEVASISFESLSMKGPSSKQLFVRKPTLTARGHAPGQDRVVNGETAATKVVQNEHLAFVGRNLDGTLASAKLVKAQPRKGERFLFETQDGQSVTKAEFIGANITSSGDTVTITPNEPLVPGEYAIVPQPALRAFTFQVLAAPSQPTKD